ncbi:MAG: hypothetical protein IJ415_00800 [Clostridia bacterium]|nr:hypothetical protein [Clostridia bacterium]
MTKASKNSKLLITLVLLALAFFCSFNVTYSYFTATAKESGSLTFSDLDVRFIYMDASDSTLPSGEYTQDNLYTINLYPVGGTISRGQEFQLSATENGSAISNLAIRNMTNSTTAYVRFWIDAYIVTSTTTNEDGTINYSLDTSTNYGKYFFLVNPQEGSIDRGSCNSGATEGSWCHYLMGPIYSYGKPSSTYTLGNTLIMKDISETDAVPPAVLGSQLKITISLQAVQTAHEAFKTEFDDAKGYYSGTESAWS